MKYLLFLAASLSLIPAAFAQADVVGVWADPAVDYCLIPDTPGPRTLYVVHAFSTNTTASSFRIEHSNGFTGTLLGSSSPFANVTGDPVSGMTIEYDNTCQTGTFHILTLNFMFYGTSPDCSWVRIAPDPLTRNCNFEWYAGDWEGTHVSSIGDCPNDIDHEEHTHFCRPFYEPTVRAESTTWGAVKALYR